MRQRQVIKEVATETGLKQTEVKTIVDQLIYEIAEQLIEVGQTIDLDHFGSFSLLKHKEKQAVIPGKNDPVLIPEHFKVQFKPSDSLKDEIKSIEK